MHPQTIIVFRPDKPMFFKAGESRITFDGIETQVVVSKILAIPIFRYVKIYLSNRNSIVFSGLPYQADLGENSFN